MTTPTPPPLTPEERARMLRSLARLSDVQAADREAQLLENSDNATSETSTSGGAQSRPRVGLGEGGGVMDCRICKVCDGCIDCGVCTCTANADLATLRARCERYEAALREIATFERMRLDGEVYPSRDADDMTDIARTALAPTDGDGERKETR